MNSIPLKAYKIGAESIFPYPISYGKSRLAGSIQTTYILHSKGGCMPGQRDIFNETAISTPELNAGILQNRIISKFKEANLEKSCRAIGPKFQSNYLNLVSNS